VTGLVGTTTLEVNPELPQVTVISWELQRNSVSAALAEAERLIDQLRDLQEVIDAYTVPMNMTIQRVLDLLIDQHMDRAINLLLTGQISSFISMAATDSSYTGAAKSAMQTVGASTQATESTKNNVAGINPATGTSTSNATSSATTSASTTISEEVDAVVSLASGVNELAGDEIVQAAAQVSLEEIRNRAIFELTGEVESSVVTDTDPTLPWLAVTGSRRQRIEERSEEMLAAIQYMIDNPDEFEESTSSE
jgi:hypothetical protein